MKKVEQKIQCDFGEEYVNTIDTYCCKRSMWLIPGTSIGCTFKCIAGSTDMDYVVVKCVELDSEPRLQDMYCLIRVLELMYEET